MAQGLKILPAMQKPQETQAGSLGWEYTLEKETQPTSILIWEISWKRSFVGYIPWGHRVRNNGVYEHRIHSIKKEI